MKVTLLLVSLSIVAIIFCYQLLAKIDNFCFTSKKEGHEEDKFCYLVHFLCPFGTPQKQNSLKINRLRGCFCAQNRTRTCTSLRTLVPETNASTNSAIWAYSCKQNMFCICQSGDFTLTFHFIIAESYYFCNFETSKN